MPTRMSNCLARSVAAASGGGRNTSVNRWSASAHDGFCADDAAAPGADAIGDAPLAAEAPAAGGAAPATQPSSKIPSTRSPTFDTNASRSESISPLTLNGSIMER